MDLNNNVNRLFLINFIDLLILGTFFFVLFISFIINKFIFEKKKKLLIFNEILICAAFSGLTSIFFIYARNEIFIILMILIFSYYLFRIFRSKISLIVLLIGLIINIVINLNIYGFSNYFYCYLIVFIIINYYSLMQIKIKKINIKIDLIFYFIFLIVLFFIETFLILDEINIQYLFVSLINYLLLIITIVILYFFNKIFINTYNLYLNSIHDNEFNTKNIIEKLNLFIDENKVEFAFLLLINVDELKQISEKYGRFTLLKTKKIILEKFIVNLRSKNKFLIKQKENYFVFIKIDNLNYNNIKLMLKNNYKKRTEDDLLIEFQEILDLIPNEIGVKNEKFKLRTSVLASIYGIRSNDINFLLNEQTQLIKLVDIAEKTVLLTDYNFTFYDYFQKGRDLINYLTFNNKQERKIEFKKVEFFNKKGIIIYKSEIIENIFLKEDKNISNLNEFELDLYQINVAVLIMKEFFKTILVTSPKAKLIFKFPFNFFQNKEFNFQLFKSNIEYFNLKINNLILEIDLNHFVIDFKSIRVIENLKTIKLGICLVNLSKNNYFKIENLNADFIKFDLDMKDISKNFNLIKKLKISHSKINILL